MCVRVCMYCVCVCASVRVIIWEVTSSLDPHSTLTQKDPQDVATAKSPALSPLFPYSLPHPNLTGSPSFPQLHPACLCLLAHFDVLCPETLTHFCTWQPLHALVAHLCRQPSWLHSPSKLVPAPPVTDALSHHPVLFSDLILFNNVYISFLSAFIPSLL